MDRREAVARALFRHDYPKGFGREAKSWDDLAREAQEKPPATAPFLAAHNPIRASRLLGMYLNAADVAIEAYEANGQY